MGKDGRRKPSRSFHQEDLAKVALNPLPLTSKTNRLGVVVVGDTNSGKSTASGHLLVSLGFAGNFIVNAENVNYAWVTDTTAAERERGSTINVGVKNFLTPRYDCTIYDCPGDNDFMKNTINGISQADCAMLFVDATPHAFEDGLFNGHTREHARLLFVLGVKDIICCVNKMDSAEYSMLRYEQIVQRLSRLMEGIGFKKNRICFVPISGVKGDNLVVRSVRMGWYRGSTVIEAIDKVSKPMRSSDKPLRVTVADVLVIGGIHTVAVGRVSSGILKPNIRVIFGPSGSVAEVESVQRNGERVDEALPGDSVGFSVVSPACSIKRGFVVSSQDVDPVKSAVSFTSKIIALKQIPTGFIGRLFCHTANAGVSFDEIMSKIDRITGEELEHKPLFLNGGDAGIVRMTPHKLVVVEPFSEYPALGRFVVRDKFGAVAFGFIQSVDKKNNAV